MSRIQTAFQRLQGEGRKALIPFITAGDPDADLTVPLMQALVAAGPTSSSSACRFPTRWPTAPPFSALPSVHWRAA